MMTCNVGPNITTVSNGQIDNATEPGCRQNRRHCQSAVVAGLMQHGDGDIELKRKSINSENAPVAVGGYSQALLVENFNRVLFISGQIPVSKQGDVPVDFKSQCRMVWENVVSQLKAADMEITNLVKVTTYLSFREYSDENGSIRREYLGDHSPALTVLIAGIYDEKWLLEIEAYAAA